MMFDDLIRFFGVPAIIDDILPDGSFLYIPQLVKKLPESLFGLGKIMEFFKNLLVANRALFRRFSCQYHFLADGFRVLNLIKEVVAVFFHGFLVLLN